MKIVIAESNNYSRAALEIYRSMGDVVLCNNLSITELKEKAKDADILVVRLAHDINADFFNGTNLKAICTPTTGLDHIDIESAKNNKIRVFSLRGEQNFLSTISATPENTFALMLSILRNIPSAHNHVFNGGWNRDLFIGRELKNSVIGLYGFGRVARIVSKYAFAFSAKVIAYDPYTDDAIFNEYNVKRASRADLFKQCNILSIHALLTSETNNSIGESELSLMQRGSFVVNTARGQIIDEHDLVKMLESGHIAGCAVDVLGNEGDGENWLENNVLLEYAKKTKNVIITPHISGATIDSMHETEEFIANKCRKYMRDNDYQLIGAEQFDSKWTDAIKNKGEEFTLYVEENQKPSTQRQFNLYNYMEFIDNELEGHCYKDALELGAGRGTISLYLRKRHGFNVALNDVSDSAMRLARANFNYFNEPADFQVGDATHLPFSDNSFDVVSSIGLLEHLENYCEVLREIERVLKPNGVMIQINIPKKYSIQIINQAYRKVLLFFGVELRQDFWRNSDNPQEYKNNAINTGFVNVRTVNVNPFPLFVPIPMFIDRFLTKIYRCILFARGFMLVYPFETNYWFSQCHFLVGYKKSIDSEKQNELKKEL